jgi:exonuclease VII large subunit
MYFNFYRLKEKSSRLILSAIAIKFQLLALNMTAKEGDQVFIFGKKASFFKGFFYTSFSVFHLKMKMKLT